MVDVFLSYKREDLPTIERLRDALEVAGLTVWVDRDTPGGDRWRSKITATLEEARCVIVVWSSASVCPAADFVHDEATRAKARGVLLPVRIEPVDPPLGFGEIQALDLVGWTGSVEDPRLQDVVAATRAILEEGPRPQPRWPARRRRRRVLTAAVGVPLIAVAVLALSFDARRLACWVPGVRSLCASAGIGGVPSDAEQAGWKDALARTDGEGLRAYLERYPEGIYATEARARLAACREVGEHRWTSQTRRLPLTVRTAREPLSTEAEARTDAERRAVDDAGDNCAPFSQGPFRLDSSSFEVGAWHCGMRDSGWACGFDGTAVCEIKARSTFTRERCGPTTR